MFNASARLLSTKQLAAMIGISVSTVERWRSLGNDQLPPHIKLSSGAIRYNPHEVQFWLDSKTQKASIQPDVGTEQ